MHSITEEDTIVLVDVKWLKNNVTQECLVIEKWNNTYGFRQFQIKKALDILKDWPILKQAIGKELVSPNGV